MSHPHALHYSASTVNRESHLPGQSRAAALHVNNRRSNVLIIRTDLAAFATHPIRNHVLNYYGPAFPSSSRLEALSRERNPLHTIGYFTCS